MSSKNDEAAGAMALIGVVLMAVGLILFAVMTFLALLLTILAIAAWNEPVRLLGHTVTPDEARVFVGRGICGAMLAPAFALFCGVLFEVRIPPDWWGYIIMAGYALGSVGVGIIEAQAESERTDYGDILPPPRRLPPPPPAPAPMPKPEPEFVFTQYTCTRECPMFRYAVWDDAKEFGLDQENAS